MKTNIILKIIIGILIVIGGIYLFSNEKNKAPDTSKLTSSSFLELNKKIHDFGEIDIFGGKVTTEFELINNGTEEIIINEGTTSCGCTNAEIGGINFGMHERMSEDFVIPAGETRNITVIYDPLAHGPSALGLAQRSVFIRTNSEITPELEMRIKAMVINNEQ